MSKITYKFANSGEKEFNDIIFPGAPFLLDDHNYSFSINPNCDFWRFGIRLSKTRDIKFVDKDDRHLGGGTWDHRDVFITIGERPNGKWQDPSILHVAQRNFPEKDVKHILKSEVKYVSRSIIAIDIGLDKERDLLDVRIRTDFGSWGTSIPLDPEFKFFKVFAWADGIPFDLDCTLEIDQLNVQTLDNRRLSPFRIGNVTFRLGDMFDSFPLYNSSIIVFPVASDGLSTASIENKITEFGLPYPKEKEAGQIDIHKVTVGANVSWVVYAYSVGVNKSNIEIIASVCRELSTLKKLVEEHKFINLPLLGTGAGRLDATSVAKIYDQEFNASGLKNSVLVSIQSGSTYINIREYFVGRFESLDEEVKQKPKSILELEKSLRVSIDHSGYEVNKKGEITELSLFQVKAPNLGFLQNFLGLQSLNLNHCTIDNFSFLSRLTKLSSFSLNKTPAKNYSFINSLKKIENLDISTSSIPRPTFLANLPKLKTLSLSDTKITDLALFEKLINLEHLNLSFNSISDIKSLSKLNKLRTLNLSHNSIIDISPLGQLHSLETLMLVKNKIERIVPVLAIKKLNFLKADQNPFVSEINVNLSDKDNHLPPIKNYYLRQMEEGKQDISLPAKIVLLGNHASGKSSLLKYFLNGKIDDAPGTTHIINIEKYQLKDKPLPEAIFFDFGGQDYYHGIYRAFLSGGSVYIVLWNNDHNFNNQRKGDDGIMTQDFTLNYWLSQKKYLEKEEYGGKTDPALVIQSRLDKGHPRISFNGEKDQFRIDNEFYVSLLKTNQPPLSDIDLVNKSALEYLKVSIIQQINLTKKNTSEPMWYIAFLSFILMEGAKDSHIAKSVEKDILPYYKMPGKNQLASLQIVLDELHSKGLILYYKNYLPDIVWLNPVKLAEHVHKEILDKNKVGGGRVTPSAFNTCEPNVMKLLEFQKVIFKHETPKGVEYIIPNFLPLVNSSEPDYDLFTFELGQPIFILKFTDFLPFGLINQLICFFKDFGNDKKIFWRDQLLFTFREKAKILINVNFQKLEIKTHCFFSKETFTQDKKDIEKYLFYSIMSLYWNLSLLNFEEYLQAINKIIKKEDYPPENSLYNKLYHFERLYEAEECRPTDLFISIDEKHFINYLELCSVDEAYTINSYLINEEGQFSEYSVPLSIFPFQTFTTRILKKTKKVCISYSKKDLKLVNKFKDYLVPLYQNGLIEEPWYCTDLIAGKEWNEEITQKFNEADIIFFMISENLMSTRYVLENEIKNAIDKWDKDKSIKIIPIQLVPYNFVRKEPYNLGRFVGLPYMLIPITEFKNQKMAWHTISESVRIMIEKEFDPGSSGKALTDELRTIYEKFVKEKFD